MLTAADRHEIEMALYQVQDARSLIAVHAEILSDFADIKKVLDNLRDRLERLIVSSSPTKEG